MPLLSKWPNVGLIPPVGYVRTKMKFRQNFIFAVFVLSCLAVNSYQSSGQQQKTWTRDALIAEAREIMTTTRYCALITTDGSGRAQARTMDAFAPDDKMVVWFGTNPLSRKVAEIRRHPRVTLYYFDRE